MTISALSWGGEGIGRIEGKVIFVPYSLPGEVVEVEILHSKKSYCQGKILAILTPSPERIAPACAYYQKCGGCQFQHLSYLKQVQTKERLFRESLDHALRSGEIPIEPTLNSPLDLGYRHRLQLKTAWKNKGFTIGFFGPGSQEIVPIERCLLANDEVNKVLGVLWEKIPGLAVKEWTPEIEIQAFERPPKGGIVFSSFRGTSKSLKKKITEAILSASTMNYILFQESDPPTLKGVLPFSRELDSPEFFLPLFEAGPFPDIRFKAFPGVFTQINLDLNRMLIGKLGAMKIFDRQETLLDLYCGLGNFSLPVTRLVQEVIGIEDSPVAVANALWNQKINGISNCTFVQARADEGIKKVKKLSKPISFVILDPPRTGAREVIPLLDAWDLKGILYISCNPMTLFRDLISLKERGWRTVWTQPIDFFPQTYHLESVTLVRKNNY